MNKLAVLLPLLMATPAFAQPLDQAVVGTISGFECGDNCYLTIATSETTQLTGLCIAEACEPWNEAVELPSELVGRAVTVVLGTGSQLDAEGTDMGPFIAFAEIRFD